MRILYEQSHRPATVSLAELLYPDRGRPPLAGGTAFYGRHSMDRRRNGALSHLLHGLAARITAWRERRAVTHRLSEMSDRELADIGLSRAQIHCVFDPEFARAGDILRRW